MFMEYVQLLLIYNDYEKDNIRVNFCFDFNPWKFSLTFN